MDGLKQIALVALATLGGLAMTFSAVAAEPADADIKAALYDIERYEQQFAGVTEARDSQVNRTLKLLSIAKGRLDASPNKSHASWQEAATRYNALVEKLNGFLGAGGGAAPAAAPSPPAAPAAPAQPAAPAAPQMISHARVRLNKLNRDIQSATQTLDQNGPKPFQDPAYLRQAEQRGERFAGELAAYDEFAGDPDVEAARASLQAYEEMLAIGRQLGAQATADLGDVQQRLRTFEERMRSVRVPPAPQAPYENDAIGVWFAAIAQVRAVAQADVPELQKIKAEASLPLTRGTVQQGAAYDSQDVDRLIRAHQDNLRRADQEGRQLQANLGAQVGEVERLLGWIDGLDPNDGHARSNNFLGEGNREEIHGQIATQRQIVEGALAFARSAGAPNVAQLEQLLQRTEAVRVNYDRRRAQALELSRMPQPASTDAELLKIARETLANPSYGVGEIKRLVINSDKVTRSKESSEVEVDEIDVSLAGDVTLSGTETTTHYEWDEYQVATAEPVGDRHYVFYNTLKFFRKGATTTTLNRWVLSGRIQGDEILAENIGD